PRARPRGASGRRARDLALSPKHRRAERAHAKRREDPDRHHRRPEEHPRHEDSDRPGEQGRSEDLRRRQPRRRTRHLAVQRRVLARRARFLPAGRRIRVWKVKTMSPKSRAFSFFFTLFGSLFVAAAAGAAPEAKMTDLSNECIGTDAPKAL